MKKIVSVLGRSFTLSLLASALLWLASGTAQAGLYYWIGTNSTDWSDLTNWKGATNPVTGGAPGLFDAVIFVNNGNANPLYYTAAQGTTITSNTSGEASGRGIRVGAETANGVMYITGGSLELRTAGAQLFANGNYSGTLVIDGGTLITTNATSMVDLGWSGTGSATVTVNSGSAIISGITSRNVARGVVNLNGGTLTLGQLYKSGTAALIVNMSGGTLQAWKNTTDWLANAGIYTVSSGVTFDTQGYNVTNAANLDGAGSITKIGNGLMALTGTNVIGGGITLNAGTLAVNNTQALGTAPSPSTAARSTTPPPVPLPTSITMSCSGAMTLRLRVHPI